MSMAIECIINFRLKIHQNSHAEQKHFLIKLNEKEFSFVVPLKIYFSHIKWAPSDGQNTVMYLNIM